VSAKVFRGLDAISAEDHYATLELAFVCQVVCAMEQIGFFDFDNKPLGVCIPREIIAVTFAPEKTMQAVAALEGRFPVWCFYRAGSWPLKASGAR
jgi:hypothetical protein